MRMCAELFTALRTGYGAFGVIVTVDVSTVPLWTMEYVSSPWILKDLRAALPSLLQQYERLQWYYTPYTPNATLLVRANTTAPITGCWSGNGNSGAPVTPPPTGMSAWPVGTTACIDLSYKTMTHNGDDAMLYTEMEMMVPAQDHILVMDDVLTFQQSVSPIRNPAVSLFTGVRYVKADDITLSPFHGRDTAVVSMIIFGNATFGGDQTQVKLFDQGIETILFDKYAARPHPGKMNYFNASMMEAVYGSNLSEFVLLVQSVDPTGRMVNEYTANLLGLAQGARIH
jgi:hypothetical protein